MKNTKQVLALAMAVLALLAGVLGVAGIGVGAII